jgi:dihydroorotase
MNRITIIKPDDWHLHLRAGEELKSVVDLTAKQMKRAIIMPNLTPPVTNVEMAEKYRSEIKSASDPRLGFEPLMTIYLTDKTDPEEISKAKTSGVIYGAKLYPAGATTNSESGVTDIKNIYSVLEKMEKENLILQVHGEVVDPEIDIFDREAVFIDKVLEQVTRDFPELKIVFEHITTKDAVDYVSSKNNNMAATITAHHLLSNRNDMLVGGIKPHYYCLPILKRKKPHQEALIEAATSGNPKFFLGTDSAPHAKKEKESSCGCAGVLSSLCAIELYAEVFEAKNALPRLEDFASINGPNFYGLEPNQETITLEKITWKIPSKLPYPGGEIIPFLAGREINWKLV